MTLTAGDLDKLKEINPGTLRIRAVTDEHDNTKEHLFLVCTKVRDQRDEAPMQLLQLDGGQDFFEHIIRAVLAHQRLCHEPRGHRDG